MKSVRMGYLEVKVCRCGILTKNKDGICRGCRAGMAEADSIRAPSLGVAYARDGLCFNPGHSLWRRDSLPRAAPDRGVKKEGSL